jgi:hypothetical protein
MDLVATGADKPLFRDQKPYKQVRFYRMSYIRIVDKDQNIDTTRIDDSPVLKTELMLGVECGCSKLYQDRLNAFLTERRTSGTETV